MSKLRVVCFATLLLTLPDGLAQGAPERIASTLAGYYRADAPGATIIVTQNGKTVFRHAFGMADVAHGQTMTPEMRLPIASLSKQFTAAAIMLLAEQGKLALDDDLHRYLPAFPTQGKRVTIAHLLTHTAGIVNYTTQPGYSARLVEPITVQGLINQIASVPLEFAPGTRWHYSNSGYVLLGAILEKVSGQPYCTFLAERIFQPLGMLDTACEGQERRAHPHAAGHARTAGGFGPAPFIHMSQAYAASNLVSTVDDLALWNRAMDDAKLLPAASWRQMFTPYALAGGRSAEYGYGWFFGTVQNLPSQWHSGSIPGFATYALRLPEQGVYVAVLGNASSGTVNPEVVAMKAAAIVIGKPFPQWQAVAVEPGKLDDFAGFYKVDERHVYTIWRERDTLRLQRGSGAPVVLAASAAERFFVENGLVTLRFQRAESGKVNRMIVSETGTEAVAWRAAHK